MFVYVYGPPHMAKQKQDDQLELTYSSYMRTQDVTLKTCQRRWMIGRSGERGSGISVPVAQHDDDDDDDIYIYIYIYICMFPAWCFHQRTYLVQDLVNGVSKKLELTRVCSLNGFYLLMVFFMNAGPSFFLDCVFLCLLYLSFTFWYLGCVCVCVCWCGFGFHL